MEIEMWQWTNDRVFSFTFGKHFLFAALQDQLREEGRCKSEVGVASGLVVC
jgi:hypothetical protein